MSHLPRKTDKFSASASAASQAKRARNVSRQINDGILQAARRVGTDAELIYQQHAPRRTGRLARGIRATAAGDQVFVTARAIDPKTQFDYVDVTRFGHRKRFIVPVNRRGTLRRSRTVTRTAGGQFSKRGAGMLVFTSRGKLWRLRRVRGFRPHGDWVEEANPAIKIIADTEMEKLSHAITVTWGG